MKYYHWRELKFLAWAQIVDPLWREDRAAYMDWQHEYNKAKVEIVSIIYSKE